MATCKYDWPDANHRELIGKRIDRIDGPEKSSGRAKYTYDQTQRAADCQALHLPVCARKVSSIDISAAKSLPGVKAVLVVHPAGDEIQWAGEEVAVVAAVNEEIAEDAVRRIKVEYEQLPHLVREEDLKRPKPRAVPKRVVSRQRATPPKLSRTRTLWFPKDFTGCR